VLFKQANTLDLFRAQFRWLLLEDCGLPSPEEVYLHLNAALDSNVMVGRRMSWTGFTLLEVYKRGMHADLVRSVTGTWQTSNTGIEPTSSPITSIRRTNIHQSVIKAVMVVGSYLNCIHFYLTNPTKQSPSSEADSHSASQEIPRLLRNPCSQQPATGPYPESTYKMLQTYIPFPKATDLINSVLHASDPVLTALCVTL